MRPDRADLRHALVQVVAPLGRSLRRGLASSGNAAEASLMATTVLMPLAAAAVLLLVVLAARASFLS